MKNKIKTDKEIEDIMRSSLKKEFENDSDYDDSDIESMICEGFKYFKKGFIASQKINEI